MRMFEKRRVPFFMSKVLNQPTIHQTLTDQPLQEAGITLTNSTIINSKLSKESEGISLENSCYSRTIINSRLTNFLTGNETIKVKIYNELITNIVKNRKVRNRYQTNRIFKPICTYFILKSLTTSGVIRDYCSLPILDVLQIGKTTFYKHLRELESLHLVKRTGESLQLASYEKMIEIFDLLRGSTNITVINYQTKYKFYQLVEGSILFNSQKEQRRVVESKINAVPELVEWYKCNLSVTKQQKYFQKALLEKQIFEFRDKKETSEEINFVNADVQLTARNIRKRYGFKSYKSVAFLKARLQKNKIVKIEKRSVMSTDRARKKQQYVEYNHEARATIWRLPDKIDFAPGLYS